MCNVKVSVENNENNYIVVEVKKKKIKCLTSPVLIKYTKVNSFDKKTGMLSLTGQMNLRDGTTVYDEDWIDLNETLSFAFKDPGIIINEIDSVQLA